MELCEFSFLVIADIFIPLRKILCVFGLSVMLNSAPVWTVLLSSSLKEINFEILTFYSKHITDIGWVFPLPLSEFFFFSSKFITWSLVKVHSGRIFPRANSVSPISSLPLSSLSNSHLLPSSNHNCHLFSFYYQLSAVIFWLFWKAFILTLEMTT